MLLFLDVVLPLPEFSLIEENKIIFTKKITKNHKEKLSDHIFEIFIDIENKFNILNKLKKVAITAGPGSYTSLRVGSSFISGLKISRNLNFFQITPSDIIKFKSNSLSEKRIGIYIQSANSQNFFCEINQYGQITYTKIENNDFVLPSHIKKIFYNFKKLDVKNNILNQVKFSFAEEIIVNQKFINFSTKQNVEPIYVSNNTVLN